MQKIMMRRLKKDMQQQQFVVYLWLEQNSSSFQFHFIDFQPGKLWKWKAFCITRLYFLSDCAK